MSTKNKLISLEDITIKEKIFTLLESKKNHGLILGRMDYDDDLSMTDMYGLMIENNSLKLFTFKFPISKAKKPIEILRNSDYLPNFNEDHHMEYENYPTTQKFLNNLNSALENQVLINLNEPYPNINYD